MIRKADMEQMQLHQVIPLYNGINYQLEVMKVPNGWMYHYFGEVYGLKNVDMNSTKIYGKTRKLLHVKFVPETI